MTFLNGISYRDVRHYKYQLVETYSLVIALRPPAPIDTPFITLDMDGRITIGRGYSWDGASGPTWDSDVSMRGGLLHDALYQLMRMGLLPQSCRLPSDMILRDTCLKDGMWAFRAKTWYKFVRRFGAASAALQDRDDL